MPSPGTVVLFEFPRTDQTAGKLRPALVISPTPGTYSDHLICMISSQLNQAIDGFDEIVSGEDSDFDSSGLKESSVIRISRVAVVDEDILEGMIGEISDERLSRIQQQLSEWITGNVRRND